MADGVLWQTAGPAADQGDLRVGDGAENAGEFEAGDGGDLVVVAGHHALGAGASEEGADEAATGWDALVELLINEGAGEQAALGCLRIGLFCLGDQEAEAGGDGGSGSRR